MASPVQWIDTSWQIEVYDDTTSGTGSSNVGSIATGSGGEGVARSRAEVYHPRRDAYSEAQSTIAVGRSFVWLDWPTPALELLVTLDSDLYDNNFNSGQWFLGAYVVKNMNCGTLRTLRSFSNNFHTNACFDDSSIVNIADLPFTPHGWNGDYMYGQVPYRNHFVFSETHSGISDDLGSGIYTVVAVLDTRALQGAEDNGRVFADLTLTLDVNRAAPEPSSILLLAGSFLGLIMTQVRRSS